MCVQAIKLIIIHEFCLTGSKFLMIDMALVMKHPATEDYVHK